MAEPRGPAPRIPRPQYDAGTHEFCTKCRQVKPHAAFPKGSKASTKHRSGLHHWCLACNAAAEATYQADPANLRKHRDAQAAYARRKRVAQGARPPDYWDGVPILENKPGKLRERLAALGYDPTDIEEMVAQAIVLHPRAKER